MFTSMSPQELDSPRKHLTVVASEARYIREEISPSPAKDEPSSVIFQGRHKDGIQPLDLDDLGLPSYFSWYIRDYPIPA